MFMFQLENPPFCNNPSCGKREKKGKGREKKKKLKRKVRLHIQNLVTKMVH